MDTTELHGLFLQNVCQNIALSLLALLIIGYLSSPLIIWTIAGGIILFGFKAPMELMGAYLVVMFIFNIPVLRANIISSVVVALFKKFNFIPKISETERTALEAGVVWVEKDLFSGKPDFQKVMAEPYPQLTAEEKAFLDGPVEKLCQMVNPWKIWKTRIIPQEVWDYIKKEKFLGMIIPKEYGGLGFSALCHSEVIMKLSSRSMPTTISVMVPNSLGPAELIIHYGTDEQKKNLLPRLARGEDMPCFGLTEPLAGSDAGSISSSGVLFKGNDGKLYIKLNWNKRWITLASISTILGLAFRLRDPENLLGKGEDVGITCALVPVTTPGVVVGRQRVAHGGGDGHSALTVDVDAAVAGRVEIGIQLLDRTDDAQSRRWHFGNRSAHVARFPGGE